MRELTEQEIQIAQERIDSLSSEQPYEISQIYGNLWSEITNKVTFGQAFSSAVREEKLLRIRSAGKRKANNHQLYEVNKNEQDGISTEKTALIGLRVNNFTVFRKAEFNFSPNLNVIVGENSSGKSHILKLIYSLIATSSKMGRKQIAPLPSKLYLEKEGYADKLSGVFRFESLGRLANRQHGQGRCEVALDFQDSALNTAISFTGKAQTGVQVDQLPTRWDRHIPVYFPTRELLTIYPGFVSMYDTYHLTFEETWYDTCLQLGGLVLKGQREAQAATLIDPIEAALGGKLILDNNNGRFYLNTPNLGRVEMPLLAEGLRKLAMLARLIATGAIQEKSYLFWDEPEANLNPHLIKLAAEVIYKLSLGGVQVFIATHSLFLLRELEILMASSKTKPSARFFGLHVSDEGVLVAQGDSMDDIGDITALEESLQQSDRYLAMEG